MMAHIIGSWFDGVHSTENDCENTIDKVFERVWSIKLDVSISGRLRENFSLFDNVKKFNWIDSPMAAFKWGKWRLINNKWEHLWQLEFDDVIEAFKCGDEIYFSVLVCNKFWLIDSEWNLVCVPMYDSNDDIYNWLKSYKLDSRFVFEKFRHGNIEPLIVNASPSIGNMIVKWLSIGDGEVDRQMLVNEIGKLGKKDKVACKDMLESVLSDNIIKLIFWNNKQALDCNFSWNDLYYYVTSNYDNSYIYTTDFGYNLAQKNIYIDWKWKVLDKKISLSVWMWIQRWINGVCVDIPFIRQNKNWLWEYKVDKDKIKVEYLWNNDKNEIIVRLVEFLLAIQKYSINPSNQRELWIFGVNEEK